MDINEGVPLPKKLEKAPEVASGVPLPPKLEKVNLKPADVVPVASKVEPVFRPSDNVPPLRVTEDRNRPRILSVTIQRPVEESARLAGSGFDLEKIKRDAEQRVPNMFDKPAELPSKLRALGNREEKVFEPAGSSIPSFVASDNTQIKLSGEFGIKMGPAIVKQCGVAFEAPKMGEPMMRRVKIVWPTPMEKAPTKPQVPLQGVDSPREDDFPASFPGQALPTGAQPVKLQSKSQAQIPMPRRPEPKFVGLQSPPPMGPRELGPGEGGPSVDEILAAAQKQVEGLIKKTAGIKNTDPAGILAELAERAPESILAQIATRAQAIMSREAKAKDLEAENAALREIVKTLGGKVALYEVELQILKAKKG